MLALFCPTAVSYEGVPDLSVVAASSPRQRRVLEHLVGLALELQLELTLCFPTLVRAVAQACSVLLRLGRLGLVVGCQYQFRYGTRQALRCARLSQHQRVACTPGTATQMGRCVARGIRLQSSCAMGRRELYGSCRRCTSLLHFWHLLVMSETTWRLCGRLPRARNAPHNSLDPDSRLF